MCLLAFILNTLYTCGRRVQTTYYLKNHKIVKNLTNFRFRYYVWIHQAICIQLSTNMLSIGLVIPEIEFETWNFMKTKTLDHG